MDLRDRTLTEIQLVKDILRISLKECPPSGISLTADQVRDFYVHLYELWPPETRIYDLIGDSAERLRGFYWGSAYPRTIGRTLTRYCLYYDEILVLDPCANYTLHSPTMSPLEYPEKYCYTLAHESLSLLQMEPWVRKGFVSAIPHPAPFDPALVHQGDIATQAHFDRLKSRQPQLYEEWKRHAFVESAWELFIGTPPGQVGQYLDRMESVSEHEKNEIIARVEAEQAELGIPCVDFLGKAGKGMTMKLAEVIDLTSMLAFSMLSNAFPFTDREDMWVQLRSVAGETDGSTAGHIALAKALARFDFKFPNSAPVELIASMREDGALSRLRAFLHDVWDASSTLVEASDANARMSAFVDRLEGEYERYRREWEDIDRKLVANYVIGGAAAGIAVLTGQLNWHVALGGLATLGAKQLVSARMDRRKVLREPLGVFIRLAGQR